MKSHSILVDETYQELYPDKKSYVVLPDEGMSLGEIRLKPVYSELDPFDPSLKTKIGPIELNIPILSAPMDRVTGGQMAGVMFEIGGCGVIYRHPDADVQINWIRKTARIKPCLVSKPRTVLPSDKLGKVWDILEKDDFSTIPVVESDGRLKGIIFTRDISFRGSRNRLDELVSKWMIPVESLKTELVTVDFERVKQRLLNEQQCSTLPVVTGDGMLAGIYFMKDFFVSDPSFFGGSPVVGMAIGAGENDVERAVEGLKAGANVIVIDSSHGSSLTVIEQTERISRLKLKLGYDFALISGNVADIDGYYLLGMAGADAVKVGIGSGSICTTSSVTGVGVPMFKALREINYLREKWQKKHGAGPQIIADGGIDGAGASVIALAAGADAVMAGRWLAGAKEALSYNDGNGFKVVGDKKYVEYRGMASDGAIRERSSYRYGEGKRAAEGTTGYVPYRGALKSWIGKDLELMGGGFAHVGCKTIQELHEFGHWQHAFERFSPAGINLQINPQVF